MPYVVLLGSGHAVRYLKTDKYDNIHKENYKIVVECDDMDSYTINRLESIKCANREIRDIKNEILATIKRYEDTIAPTPQSMWSTSSFLSGLTLGCIITFVLAK